MYIGTIWTQTKHKKIYVFVGTAFWGVQWLLWQVSRHHTILQCNQFLENSLFILQIKDCTERNMNLLWMYLFCLASRPLWQTWSKAIQMYSMSNIFRSHCSLDQMNHAQLLLSGAVSWQISSLLFCNNVSKVCYG